MPAQEKVKIVSNQKVAPQYYKLCLKSTTLAESQPGQFIHIKCPDHQGALLRRPFSIHRKNKPKCEIEIIYKVIGKGTDSLSKAQPWEELDVLGPLGNGFKIRPDKKMAVIIGGGTGIAPLVFLADELAKQEKVITAVLGCQNKDLMICEKEFKSKTDELHIFTEDGSLGKKGLATDILPNILNPNVLPDNVQVFACGPRPMLKEAANYTIIDKYECQVSLEEYMACGIGVCYGCSVKTINGYKKVCDDGPVFTAEEIIWELG